MAITVKRIKTIALSSFTNSKHSDVVQFMVKALTLFAIIGERFERFVEAFLGAAERENEVFQRVDRTFITTQMHGADSERINFFYQIRDFLRAELRSQNPAVRVAAEKLLKLTELYGGVKLRNMSAKDRSGNLTNFIEDLEDKFQEEAELTSISVAVASLKEANTRYIELRDSRIMSDSEYGLEAMAKARANSDHTMRVLFQEVSNAAEYGEWESLKDFINYVNAGISEFNWGTGTGSGADIEIDEDGEVVVRTKTATFHFHNGNSVKLKVEVGTVLIAPTNTEGYKWKPDVPEFMPATNKTFREVPIEEAEATATFHFFDHTEEEVRQLVGSVLHAPENTAGYYWDPEVPETMPAEDTSYYELPEEEEQQEPTLYTVRFMKGSELVAEQEYEAGEVIQAPAAPSGYEWEDYPYRMPAEDITVNAVRRNIPGGGGGSGFE